MKPRAQFAAVFGALVAVALVAAGAAGAVLYAFESREASVASTHVDTAAPTLVRASEIPDVALPSERPFVGTEGVDADGYSLRTADAEALLALLHARRFEELTRYFEAYEADAERDVHDEFWIVDAIERVGNADPRNLVLLDEWVRASPDSFAPYAVRAANALGAAQTLRGNDTIANTSPAALDAMRLALQGIDADLRSAATKNPRAVAPERTRIRASMLSGRRDDREAARRSATERCPTCFAWPAVYIGSVASRWGGSAAQEDAFIAESNALVAENPRLAHVAYYAAYHRASGEGRLQAASQELARGDFWEAFVDRSDILAGQRRWPEALRDAERAHALRPHHPHVLEALALAQYGCRRYYESAETLSHALRLSPVDPSLARRAVEAVSGLAWAAQEHLLAGDSTQLAAATALATALAPSADGTLRLRGELARDAPRFAALHARVREEPDSFEAVRDLDYAISSYREWDRIIPLWNAYIARHPDDGRAYLERSGTQFHRRKLDECRADSRRACELGVRQACSGRIAACR